jgi:hypothetical protein
VDLTPLRQPELGAWQWFMREWHGDLQGYAPEELQAVRLPEVLLDYYAVAGRRATSNLHLVPPAELVVADGVVCFVIEEQGVYSFETVADSADPPVWLREDESRERLGEPLDRFLLQYALFEATIGGPVGGWGYAERAALPAIAEVMPALPLEPWPHPAGQLSFHVGDDLIGLVWDAGEERLDVWAAAHTSGRVERLDGLVDWDR